MNLKLTSLIFTFLCYLVVATVAKPLPPLQQCVNLGTPNHNTSLFLASFLFILLSHYHPDL